MGLMQTAATLIAGAVRARLQAGIRFGLIARHLPAFDLDHFYAAVAPHPDEVRLALLGFAQPLSDPQAEVATEVETVVGWRNDPQIQARIVVLINPTAHLEKTHSLDLFESFTDYDLRHFIYAHAEQWARTQNEYLQQHLWAALRKADTRERNGLSIIARQVIAFYDAVVVNQEELQTALPDLGLLPDSDLRGSVNVEQLLRRNAELVEWLANLTPQSLRNLARAQAEQGSSFHTTFSLIKHYITNPIPETLRRLSVQEVRALRSAPRGNLPDVGPLPQSLPIRLNGDLFFTDRKLTIAERPEEEQEAQRQALQDQADRIVQLFYEAVPDSDDTSDDQSASDEEDRFEVLTDLETNEERGRAGVPSPEERHPLHDLHASWVQPSAWGGQITVEIEPGEDDHPAAIFSGRYPLSFVPRNPYAVDGPHPFVVWLRQFDQALESETTSTQLVALFESYADARQSLLSYQTLFLYYPQVAFESAILGDSLSNYLSGYEAFSNAFQLACRQLQESFPDTVVRAIAEFLVFDTITLHIKYKRSHDHAPAPKVLITTLHPLHLWKWAHLQIYLNQIPRSLSAAERQRVLEATRQLPTLLNTFSIHPTTFGETIDHQDMRLVLGGTIPALASDTRIGIPYYEHQAHHLPGADGLKEFAQVLESFLGLYPPASLGLTLVVIDPPDMAEILKQVLILSRDSKTAVQLEGSRVYVFWTRPLRQASWSSIDEEALARFREDPRWMLYIDTETRSIEEIHQLLHQRHIYPHIVLLCDPSTAVVRPTFRTTQDETSPFGVPVHVTYDHISDRIQLVPSATGQIFESHLGLRQILSGGTSRSVLGLGVQGARHEDLKRLLHQEPGTSWLVILDWAQGALEIDPELGPRLLWQSAGARALSIYTTPHDWETTWRALIQRHITAGTAHTAGDALSESLLELAPILTSGMLELIPRNDQESTGTIANSRLAQIVSLVATLQWYRHEHAGVVLVPIGGTAFADWYGDHPRTPHQQDFYLALWPGEDAIGVDLIWVSNAAALPPQEEREQAIGALQTFAKQFQELFEGGGSPFILLPLRRALLRDHLVAAIFAPARGIRVPEGPLTKAQKSTWAALINRLFSLGQQPTLEIVHVRVDFGSIQHQKSVKRPQPLTNAIHAKWFMLDLPAMSGTTILPPPSSAPPAETPQDQAAGSDDERSHNIDPARQHVPPQPAVPDDQIWVQARQLHKILDAYGLAVADVATDRTQVGPRFIRYWVQLQPPSGRLSEVQKYAEDIARELRLRAVPMIDNIPGERYIGIDIERESPARIDLQPALEQLPEIQPYHLLFAAGQDPAGTNIQLDLVDLKHMLVAGQTGSGKTVFLVGLITSLLWRHHPDALQLILVDPKQVDFGRFESAPHLYNGSVLYEPDEAIETLRAIMEQERPRRMELLRANGYPNIQEYNRRNQQRLPYLVIVIDEYADLVLGLRKRDKEEFEKQINRLAATGRAAGIHLVIATQRPTTEIITGTIKANITARISFRLPSHIDSRTILDRPGAESLLGQGDMLVSLESQIQRLQGYFVGHDDLKVLVDQLRLRYQVTRHE